MRNAFEFMRTKDQSYIILSLPDKAEDASSPVVFALGYRSTSLLFPFLATPAPRFPSTSLVRRIRRDAMNRYIGIAPLMMSLWLILVELCARREEWKRNKLRYVTNTWCCAFNVLLGIVSTSISVLGIKNNKTFILVISFQIAWVHATVLQVGMNLPLAAITNTYRSTYSESPSSVPRISLGVSGYHVSL